MTKDTQIEEMAKAVCHLDRTCDECMTSFECKAMMYAKRFYTAGYRKASDVVWEIFDKVDEIAYRYLNDADYSGGDMIYDLNELKKIYTEGEG